MYINRENELEKVFWFQSLVFHFCSLTLLPTIFFPRYISVITPTNCAVFPSMNFLARQLPVMESEIINQLCKTTLGLHLRFSLYLVSLSLGCYIYKSLFCKELPSPSQMCGVHPVQRLSMLTAVINWAWANLKKTRGGCRNTPCTFFFYFFFYYHYYFSVDCLSFV